MRSQSAHVLEHFAARSTHDKHHVLWRAPFLRLAHHFFKEPLAVFIFRELEIEASLVARERQQGHPFPVVFEEGRHAVFTHVGSHGEHIDVVFVEKRASIHFRGVADVATLRIGDDEVVRMAFANVFDGFLEGNHAVSAVRLVEGEIGLVGHAVGCRGVDDGFVELHDGVVQVEQVRRNFLGVGVEPYAKKRFLGENLLNQLFSGHFISVLEFLM